uniref:Insulin-like domain-containing protein n=1 Tax=Cyprinodon variegatus TaxID=28743 RepID=A0A3Q2EG18_CYPVA
PHTGELCGLEEHLWKVLSGREKPKVKRGIVEQCCHRPCSINHLEDYCN